MNLKNNDQAKSISTTIYIKKNHYLKKKKKDIKTKLIRTKKYTMLLKFINMISDSVYLCQNLI